MILHSETLPPFFFIWSSAIKPNSSSYPMVETIIGGWLHLATSLVSCSLLRLSPNAFPGHSVMFFYHLFLQAKSLRSLKNSSRFALAYSYLLLRSKPVPHNKRLLLTQHFCVVDSIGKCCQIIVHTLLFYWTATGGGGLFLQVVSFDAAISHTVKSISYIVQIL